MPHFLKDSEFWRPIAAKWLTHWVPLALLLILLSYFLQIPQSIIEKLFST